MSNVEEEKLFAAADIADSTPSRRPRRKLWLGLFALALVALTGVLFRNPLLARWQMSRAAAAIESIQLAEAEAALRAAMHYRPDDVQAVLQLCSVLRMQGRVNESADLLPVAEQLGCGSNRVRHERALNEARVGLLQRAEPYLPRLLADDSLDSRDVCEAYVVGFRQQGRFENAELLLEAWEADWPDDYRIAAHRGVMQQMQNRWQAAVRHYEQAMKRGDPRASTRIRCGECFLEDKDSQAAVSILKESVSLAPERADAWFNLGKAYLLNGDAADARDAIEKSLRLDPVSFDARLVLARIHLREDDPQAACEILETLLEAWPEDAAALYEYGQALARLNRREEADAVVKRWEYADAQNEKIEHLVAELEADPSNLPLRIRIGKLLIEHYSRRMGLQYLMVVLQMDSDNRVAHELLVRYYTSRGETDRAALHQHALDVAPPPENRQQAEQP
jgi:predicted Zn-dependent protease